MSEKVFYLRKSNLWISVEVLGIKVDIFEGG